VAVGDDAAILIRSRLVNVGTRFFACGQNDKMRTTPCSARRLRQDTTKQHVDPASVWLDYPPYFRYTGVVSLHPRNAFWMKKIEEMKE
jgi:hypothetical protein